MKKLLISVLLIINILTIFSVTGFASGPGDITVYLKEENINTSLYKIDDCSSDNIAEIKNYIKNNNLNPVNETVSDKNCIVKFKNLEYGKYFILINDNYTAFTFELNDKQPSVTAHPKYNEPTTSSTHASTTDVNTVKYKIIKQWKNDNNTNERPEYINADIFINNIYLKTVKITKENSWQYEFNYKKDAKIDVLEHEIRHYKGSIKKDGNSIILINNYDKTYEPDTSKTQINNNSTTKTDKTTNNSVETSTTKRHISGGPLPNTGSSRTSLLISLAVLSVSAGAVILVIKKKPQV